MNDCIDNRLNFIPFLAPTKPGFSEFTEKKSVFISYSFPVESKQEAQDLLMKMKKDYPDAAHHVYAWSIRGDFFHEKYFDDHEPSGTAGLPIAGIISSNNIGNVLVVVIRYFGGILLGSGGLVRAYTKSAIDALNESGLKQVELYTSLSCNSGYSDYEITKRYCSNHGDKIYDEIYAEEISYQILIRKPLVEQFCLKISDLTSGRVIPKINGEILKPGGKIMKI